LQSGRFVRHAAWVVEQSNFSELLPNSNGLIAQHGLQRKWGDAFTIDRCNVSSPALRRAAQPKGRPMRLLYALAAAMLLTVLIPVQHASAFTIEQVARILTVPPASWIPTNKSIRPSSAGRP
jgi:hypothetical protein